MTRRKKKLKRVLTNFIARRRKRDQKYLREIARLNPTIYPYLDEGGKGWVSDENDQLTYMGGKFCSWLPEILTMKQIKWLLEQELTLDYIRAEKVVGSLICSKYPQQRYVPEGMVVCNWNEELVSFEEIKDKIIYM